jgi:hypothetical protein
MIFLLFIRDRAMAGGWRMRIALDVELERSAIDSGFRIFAPSPSPGKWKWHG